MSWLAWKLDRLKPEVAEVVAADPRFDRIAVGSDVWWWSAAALEARNQRPGEAR